MKNEISFLAGFVCGLLLAGVLGVNVVNKYQNQAISHGFGKYVVDTNKEVKFEWITNSPAIK